ncbi:hypothetical protein L596_025677 [Steinernema carpocapsae]|uniref:Uncharacterized protein n=1 Tax=Steinernema carpocapsae TaxID=34508 RepID=A0A4U5M8I3_STECR|nr:hypothetical protein L596_025677 [Steinernema carpocapsae]
MTHPFMLLLSVLFAVFITGVASDCDRFRGYEVGFSFKRRIHRFKFEGAPIDLYGQLAEQAEFQKLTTVAFTKRGHVLLAYNNELVELRFDVEHDDPPMRTERRNKLLSRLSHRLSFYVCNATDITCELRGLIDGSFDLLSATVLGDVLVVGNSSINVTTGEEALIDLELGYSTGEIFDLATGQAYDTTSEKDSRLIGVIRGKKIYAQRCGGGNRTVIKSVTYGCDGGDCSKRHKTLHLDSSVSVLNCFILDVAVIPKTPISKCEVNFTSTPSTPITTTSTSSPITTTPEPPPRYFVLKTPPGYKKREERLAQNEEEDEDEYEDDEDEEEFDITD